MQHFLDIFDIYLLEAVINGILLGGVLALLALFTLPGDPGPAPPATRDRAA